MPNFHITKYMSLHTCCMFSRPLLTSLNLPPRSFKTCILTSFVMNLYKICQIHSYPIATSIALFYHFFQIPRHKFFCTEMMLDNECAHSHFFLDRMRLAFHFVVIKTFHRDRGQIHGLHVVSYGKQLVSVGYLVPDIINEDFKRKPVFDLVFVQQEKVFWVVCYLQQQVHLQNQ